MAEKLEKLQPEMPMQPAPPAPVNKGFLLRVRLTAGSIDRAAETKEKAIALAKEILEQGITEDVRGTAMTIVYPAHTLQRVEIVPK